MKQVGNVEVPQSIFSVLKTIGKKEHFFIELLFTRFIMGTKSLMKDYENR